MKNLSMRLSARVMRPGLLSTSLLLMVSTTIVNAGNYVYNLLIGRWLGPALFADVSLIVTLFLVITFLVVPLQLTAARFFAMGSVGEDANALGALRRWFQRPALWIGLGCIVVFGLGAPLWANLFHSASTLPFVIFGLGLPFYFLQGVDRGVLQGQTRFVRLAVTYQTEMWSRLLFGVVLLAFGFAVNGAVAGLSLSFVATWLVARYAVRGTPAGRSMVPDSHRGRSAQTAETVPLETQQAAKAFAVPVMVGQLGQILINNSDILLVRYFYDGTAAGYYAALALIGRIVFFATWSVVMTMFPIVAQKHQRGEPHRHLLWASLGIVAAVAGLILAATMLVPDRIVNALFGSAYLEIAPLLWVYALATALYALANVIISYYLSLGRGRITVFAIGAGVAQIIGIILWHNSLAQVIWVQVIVMLVLFASLLVWDWLAQRRPATHFTPVSTS